MMRLKTTFCIVLIIALLTACAPAIAQLSRSDIESLRREIVEKGYSFTVSENPATEIPLDQLCGLRPPPDWQKTANFDMTLEAEVETLPSRFDWRDSGSVPSIRDQGHCGSCWAFATIGPMECAILRTTGAPVDLSEQWLVSCYRDSEHQGCGGGWWAFDPLVNPGAVYESEFPYVAWDAPCGGPYTYVYHLNSWYYVGGSSSVPSVSAIKQAIYTYGPVAAAVCVGSLFQAYSGGVFDANEGGEVNHAVVLVGWDDSQGSGGVWFLRNSWGTTWGESGYMRIGYGKSQIGYAAAYGVYTPPARGAIGGFVRDSNGQALSGATVTVTPGNYTATSLADGSYCVNNVPVGSNWSAQAQKSHYTTQTVIAITVSANQTTTVNFTLSWIPPGTLAGNVKDGGGRNLSGATVTISPGGASATTNQNGNYTIGNLEPAMYTATASKSGHADSSDTVVIISGQTTTKNFTLCGVNAELLTNGNFNNGCTGWAHWENLPNIYWGCGNKVYPYKWPGNGGHSWNAFFPCGGTGFCDQWFSGEQHQDNVSVYPSACYVASAQVYYEPVLRPNNPTDQQERIFLRFNDPANTVHMAPWHTHATPDGWDKITLSGTVPAAATKMTFKVELCDTDMQWSGTGAVDECSFLSCLRPAITTHPQSQAKNVGESVTFSAAGSGTSPLSYQWRKGGIVISGATSSSYTIASVTTSDAGSYDCVISNGCGLATSNAATLSVRIPAATIPAAKGYPDTTDVSLSNKAVTAATGSAFWIEEEDRCSGIKVVASNSLTVGTCVNAAGVLLTVNAERMLNPAEFSALQGEPKILGPLGIRNVAVGGNALNSYTPGVAGSVGTNNIGLLVRVWGAVKHSYSDRFFIDDASGRSDFPGEVGLKIASGGLSEPSSGYALVTGVVTTENIGGKNVPVILPRTQADIAAL